MPDLRDWLENAEIKYRKIFRQMSPGNRANGEIQVFAYHNRHNPDQIPVICIGSNYGQGVGTAQEKCGANLDSWLRNFFNMRDVFEQTPAWKRAWVIREWSSETFPRLPARDEIFFVMTNLCPWVTEVAWGDGLKFEESASLLNSSRLVNQFLHVEELISYLLGREKEFVLVGHGVNPNVLPSLSQFLSGRDRWLLYANLSHAKRPSQWSEVENRFMF